MRRGRRRPTVQQIEGRVRDGAKSTKSRDASCGVDEGIGAHLRRLRKMKSLTLYELSARSGLSVTHISQVERGQAIPTIRALGRFAEGLDLPIQLLLDLAATGLVSAVPGRKGPGSDGPSQRTELTRSVPGGSLCVRLHCLGTTVSGELPAAQLEAATAVHVLQGALLVRPRGPKVRAGDAIFLPAEASVISASGDQGTTEFLTVSTDRGGDAPLGSDADPLPPETDPNAS